MKDRQEKEERRYGQWCQLVNAKRVEGQYSLVKYLPILRKYMNNIKKEKRFYCCRMSDGMSLKRWICRYVESAFEVVKMQLMFHSSFLFFALLLFLLIRDRSSDFSQLLMSQLLICCRCYRAKQICHFFYEILEGYF